MTITPKQLEWRNRHIGSSDMAAIMGMSHYANMTDIWMEKTGRAEPKVDTAAIIVGNYCEEGVFRWGLDQIRKREEFIGVRYKRNYRRVRGIFAANCDAVVYRNNDPKTVIPVEVKTCGIANPFTLRLDEWGRGGTDEVPDDVVIQAHVQMIACDAPFCFVVALIVSRGFELYEIKRNTDLCTAIITAGQKFWQYVIDDKEPPIPAVSVKRGSRVGHIVEKTVPVDAEDAYQYHEISTQLRMLAKKKRALQEKLDLRYEDQTLAVYPAPLAPPPYPWPFPMDREAGIEAYRAMISAKEHRARRAAGQPPEHLYTADKTAAPVLAVVVSKVEHMTDRVAKYEFSLPGGAPMPPVTAGAHVDVVVAPEFFRQYSLSGDPADRSKYQIAVLREDEGRGGSKLLHRIFREGRRVFISYPINHFPLVEDATFTYLMGGGIGVTPMIAMAHRLHALGRDFALHYSASRKADAGFLADLAAVPWADRVHLHFSDQGTRADLNAVLQYRAGAHVYTCGPDTYMQAVIAAAEAGGFPEDARHLEYFSAPETPEYENHPFTLRLARSGRDIAVPAEIAATDALLAAGVHVDVKCSDGLCGVCKCTVLSGEVEHRDFVLSKKDRESQMVLCQSRAAAAGGVVEIDL